MPVPVGGFETTFIWQAIGALRQQTHTLGIVDLAEPLLDPSTVGTAVLGAFTVAGAPGNAGQFSNEYRFLGCSTMYQAELGGIVYNDPVSITGSFARPTPPINCSLLVDKRTGAGGRRGRGRMFVPPATLAEGDISSLGVILGADVTSIQASWDVFFGELEDNTLQPTLWHATAPFLGDPITSFVVQPLIATQRRRLRK